MMHSSDELHLSARFEQGIPEDITEEYEIRRSVYHGFGASGALGAGQLTDMLRFLGYGRKVSSKPSGTDWRDHAGRDVRVLSGVRSGQVGRFLRFNSDHQLMVKFGGSPPEPMSRINVELVEVETVSTEKDGKKKPSGKPAPHDDLTDWSSVASGTPVLVGSDAEDGEFLAFSSGKVRVKVGGREQSFNTEEVYIGE